MQSNKSDVIFVFPAGMPLSLSFKNKMQAEGAKIIGGSSLAHDSSKEEYHEWITVPYVNQSDFLPKLGEMIRKYKITKIFTPHAVVWEVLHQNLAELAPDVHLINASPSDTELAVFRSSKLRAIEQLSNQILLAQKIGSSRNDLSELALASIYRHIECIPGMCDYDKMLALYAIAKETVCGDVVEIGTWWGRSAYFLSQLASGFKLGNLLCIDPWSDEGIISNDADELVSSTFEKYSANEAFQIFLMNLLPYSRGNINYLRMPATEALKLYSQTRFIHSPEFGETPYCGNISILHIDGNHAYEAVSDDIALWAPKVSAGGWIVMDDYTWSFGDGPKRATDEFLKQSYEHLGCAFVMGGAMFIHLLTSIAKKNDFLVSY